MRISPPKGGSRNKLSELQQHYIVIRHIIRPKLPRICLASGVQRDNFAKRTQQVSYFQLDENCARAKKRFGCRFQQPMNPLS